MKVLKNSSNVKVIHYPIRHECECCASTLLVDEDDVKEGYLGMAYVVCPVCQKKTYLEIETLDKKVTIDNLKFPDNFYYTGGEGSKELSIDEIRRYIKDAINFFRNNPDNFCYMTGSGDTAIFVLNYSGDENYEITLCKGYYSTEIEYEDGDYVVDMNKLWENKGVIRKDD